MAYRVVSRSAAPSSSSKFSSSRFMFISTLSLSFTYVCYSLLFCSAPIMPTGRSLEHRCAHEGDRGSPAAKKLLHQNPSCTFPSNSDQTELKALVDAASRESARAPNRSERASQRSSRTRSPRPINSTMIAIAQRYGNKKLPNALIVGVKKGGTRAVLEFIRIHPDVRALGTEPHFFDRNYDKGLDWYR